jgi:Protein of unknown function DUF2625
MRSLAELQAVNDPAWPEIEAAIAGASHPVTVLPVLRSLTDRLEQFNRHLRWPGWRDEVAALAPNRGISVYPPPFTTEGRDLARVSRRRVPIAELLTIWDDLAEQVKDISDGDSIRIRIVDS